MQTNILPLNKIKTQTVQVSEPIVKDALLDFLFTATQQNKRDWDVTFICHYFQSSKNYFIACFQDKTHTTSLLPHVLSIHYNSHAPSEHDLFITSTFFALYCDQKMVYFKPITHAVKEEEIIHFLQESLKITIQKCYHLSDTQLQAYQEVYKKEYLLDKRHEYIYFKSIKQTLYYICFCALIVLVFFMSFFLLDALEVKKPVPSLVKTEIPIKALKTYALVEFLQRLNTFDLKLLDLTIGAQHAQVKVTHKDKSQLLDFLKAYSLKLKNLNYIKENQEYELVATFIF